MMREPERLEPAVAIRIALALKMPINPAWLTPGILDIAFSPADLAKYADRLLQVTRVLNLGAVGSVLQRDLDPKNAKALLNAFRRILFPKRGTEHVHTVLTRESSLAVVRLATSLAPILVNAKVAGSAVAAELVEAVVAAVTSSERIEFVLPVVTFMRVFEKQAGWQVLEDHRIQAAWLALLSYTSAISSRALRSGDCSQLDKIAAAATNSPAFDQHFRGALAREIEAAGPSLPLAARNWVQAYLEHRNTDASTDTESVPAPPLPVGDAARERLALLLVNAWEAREEGANASHAFSIAEEVCRNGFDVYLVGEPGSVVSFDPDVHEPTPNLKRGDQCVLRRPWIEWRSVDGIKVLIRARIANIS